MHIKTIASTLAVTVALGFGSLAYAQDAAATTTLPTMIGNQEVGEADAQRVKTYCDDLQTAANQAAGTEASDAETPQEEVADTAAVGSVDMDAITIETCLEGGWLEGVTTPE
jgi:hypothetical protein